MYSPTVLDHYSNPRFLGRFEDATHRGTLGSPESGPYLTFHLRIAGGVIERVGYETYGCAATVASGSMLATLVAGRSVAQVKRLRPEQLLKSLGGLPRSKVHCAERAIAALRLALEQRVHPAG